MQKVDLAVKKDLVAAGVDEDADKHIIRDYAAKGANLRWHV